MFGLGSKDEDNRADARQWRYFQHLRDANATRQEEWDPKGDAKNMDWRMNELAGETGECCNVLKKLYRERCDIPGSRATKDDLADELADVIICLDLTLMQGRYEPAKLVATAGITIRDLTWCGHQLFSHVARLFTVLAFGVPREVAEAADRVYSFAAMVARTEGIDLDMAVVKKFNETTRKVGLTTFLT